MAHVMKADGAPIDISQDRLKLHGLRLAVHIVLVICECMQFHAILAAWCCTCVYLCVCALLPIKTSRGPAERTKAPTLAGHGQPLMSYQQKKTRKTSEILIHACTRR
jgi:hypothetical protein